MGKYVILGINHNPIFYQILKNVDNYKILVFFTKYLLRKENYDL